MAVEVIPSVERQRRWSSTIYTLIATAKLNDVDPQTCHADVLAQVFATRFGGLLPRNRHAERRAVA